MDEELAVPLRPEQAGRGGSKDPEPQFDGSSANLRNDQPMRLGVTNYAPFPDMTFTDLELRFNQRQDVTGISKQRGENRKNRGQRNKRKVYGCEIRPIREVGRQKGEYVSSFHDGHSWIGPEFHVKLSASDINGIDMGGAMLKQTVGKPAGRCAQVEADATSHGDDELLQRALKLDTPTPYVWVLGDDKGNPRAEATRVPALSITRSSTSM